MLGLFWTLEWVCDLHYNQFTQRRKPEKIMPKGFFWIRLILGWVKKYLNLRALLLFQWLGIFWSYEVGEDGEPTGEPGPPPKSENKFIKL